MGNLHVHQASCWKAYPQPMFASLCSGCSYVLDAVALLQVPAMPNWHAHGKLEELRVFLNARVADGSFHPVMQEGL